jgi:TolB protein
MNGDSSDNTQLLTDVLEVTLDPTGQRIAYTRGVGNEVLTYQLFVGPLDNPAAAQQVTSFASGNVTGLAFRPNGEEILFASNSDGDNELYIYNIPSASQTQITNNNSGDSSPSWAPSGRQIVFASDRASPPQADIYLLDFSESGNALQANAEVLFDTTGNSTSPHFSPDGQSIVFVSENRNGSEVVVGTADGSRNRSITGADSRHIRPTWSPDGRYVYYISDARTGNLQIHYALPDGTQSERIITPGLAVQSVAVSR